MPGSAFVGGIILASTATTWDTYYRAMTGIAYDDCGPEVLQAIAGFQPLPWPGRWG